VKGGAKEVISSIERKRIQERKVGADEIFFSFFPSEKKGMQSGLVKQVRQSLAE